MIAPTPIACDLHDYIEIACMRSYEIRLVLEDDSEIVGRAKTTKTTADKLEYVVIDVGNDLIDVPTHTIVSMTALTAGASFGQIDFR